MTHKIDTKAIQELAAMSPEVRQYLEKEFPEVFYECLENKTPKQFLREYYSENGMLHKGTIWRRNITEQIDRLFIPDYKPE